jgi:hypothetical protein
MDYQKAAEVLKILYEKPSLTAEEKEAVYTAIGILAWASLAKTKKKDSKGTEWGTAPKKNRFAP